MFQNSEDYYQLKIKSNDTPIVANVLCDINHEEQIRLRRKRPHNKVN